MDPKTLACIEGLLGLTVAPTDTHTTEAEGPAQGSSVSSVPAPTPPPDATVTRDAPAMTVAATPAPDSVAATAAPPDDILIAAKTRALDEQETILDQDKDQGLRTMLALRRIRAEELYKLKAKTFAAYCKARLHIEYGRVRQLVPAADVHVELLGRARDLHSVPSTEYQLRALVSLKTLDDRVTAWNSAYDRFGREPSGREVTLVIKALRAEGKLPADKRSGKKPTAESAAERSATLARWLKAFTQAEEELGEMLPDIGPAIKALARRLLRTKIEIDEAVCMEKRARKATRPTVYKPVEKAA